MFKSLVQSGSCLQQFVALVWKLSGKTNKCGAFFAQFFSGAFGRARRCLDWLSVVLRFFVCLVLPRLVLCCFVVFLLFVSLVCWLQV